MYNNIYREILKHTGIYIIRKSFKHVLDTNSDFSYKHKNIAFNKNSIYYLERNQLNIPWCFLSENKNAEVILEKNIEYIDYNILSKNKNINIIKNILMKSPEKINWSFLSSNKSAFDYIYSIKSDFIEKNIDKIYWAHLSSNPSDYAVELLLENKKKINMTVLTYNRNNNKKIEKMIFKYLDRYTIINTIINHYYCYDNKNKNVIDYLFKTKKHINWYSLSSNAAAIDYLKKQENLKKVNFSTIGRNKSFDAMNLLIKHNKITNDNLTFMAKNKYAINILKDKRWIEQSRKMYFLPENPAIFKPKNLFY
jgi:hypothetical protein